MRKLDEEFEDFWTEPMPSHSSKIKDFAKLAFEAGVRLGLAAGMDSKLYQQLSKELELPVYRAI